MNVFLPPEVWGGLFALLLVRLWSNYLCGEKNSRVVSVYMMDLTCAT